MEEPGASFCTHCGTGEPPQQTALRLRGETEWTETGGVRQPLTASDKGDMMMQHEDSHQYQLDDTWWSRGRHPDHPPYLCLVPIAHWPFHKSHSLSSARTIGTFKQSHSDNWSADASANCVAEYLLRIRAIKEDKKLGTVKMRRNSSTCALHKWNEKQTKRHTLKYTRIYRGQSFAEATIKLSPIKFTALMVQYPLTWFSHRAGTGSLQ